MVAPVQGVSSGETGNLAQFADFPVTGQSANSLTDDQGAVGAYYLE
jgi:hypothetical protein